MFTYWQNSGKFMDFEGSIGFAIFAAVLGILCAFALRRRKRLTVIVNVCFWGVAAAGEIISCLALQNFFDTGDGYNFMMDIGYIISAAFFIVAIGNLIAAIFIHRKLK